jgi:hypothetical protein
MSVLDMFPHTDSAKRAFDVFPTTDNVKDINPPGSLHIEFLRLLSHADTLQSAFWNWWSDFIRAGNMRYIGYIMIILTLAIMVFMFIKPKKKYDEYQISIISRSLIIAGILSIRSDDTGNHDTASE